MRTGKADLPLHPGKAPPWLFQRMVRLSRGILGYMVEELGTREVLARLSDPFWFQSLGCVLGFDWHSSGVTTTTCGAIKEGLKGLERELGLFAAGGKGAASRRTPQEIEEWAGRASLPFDPAKLVHASRMSAKVDSNALQDGYQIYHHFFVFDREGGWAVVQQGMNESTGYARRYHWLSDGVDDFVQEPHAAVCCDRRGLALNLVAAEGSVNREASAQLARVRPEKLVRELCRLREMRLPRRHQLFLRDLDPASLQRVLLRAYERQPQGFAELLGLPGVGAKALRALSLIADLVHGAPVCWEDPARYSFAHGGKDGWPYPVDRRTYDRSIEAMERAVRRAGLGLSEREGALRRLAAVSPEP
jgi:hypothetical protein